MSPAGDRESGSAPLRGLVGALAPVLADAAGADVVRAARAAAQVLGLPGLERLLDECEPHAGLPWSAELSPALERLRRVAALAAESGDVTPFREADRELAGLAGEIAALRWSPARAGRDSAAAAVATLALAAALEDLPLADDASRELARRARVVPAVAAALRAALEWIAGGSGRPLALRVEDSLLEVRCEHVDVEGLTAAAEVLADVGANLGPGLGASEPWLVRVPLWAERPVRLMMVCGEVPLAVPWHAVLRLHMATGAELAGEPGAAAPRTGPGGWPLLSDPLGLGRAPATGTSPLALVAHGRKRAWIAADRLIWRLPAERVAPTEVDGGPRVSAPAGGLVAMVRTEEGERFWLADPGWLLRDVAAPVLEKVVPAPRPVPPAPVPAPPEVSAVPPAALAAPVAPEPREVVSVPPPVMAPPRETTPEPPAPPRLTVLTAADVRPVGAPAPAPPAPPKPVAAHAPAEPVGAPAPALPAPPKPVAAPAPAEPVGAPAPAPPAPPKPVAAPAPAEPVAAPAPAPPRPVEPTPVTPARPLAPAPIARPAMRTARTALVAEDSITARIFLARLLVRHGFDVRTVDTAAALRTELERGGWQLTCVDVELPDETGAAFLAGLVVRHGPATLFVALVRDADDRVAARRVGIERTLRKPFDEHELEVLLGRLGLPTTEAR
jgi:CheY-like chemotaxis protein